VIRSNVVLARRCETLAGSSSQRSFSAPTAPWRTKHTVAHPAHPGCALCIAPQSRLRLPDRPAMAVRPRSGSRPNAMNTVALGTPARSLGAFSGGHASARQPPHGFSSQRPSHNARAASAPAPHSPHLVHLAHPHPGALSAPSAPSTRSAPAPGRTWCTRT
jgi:hypothetical protein